MTTVRIHYSAITDTAVIPISQPRVPVEINVNLIYGDFTELEEVFLDGSNAISNKSFHITSDHDITLYGVNIRRMSSDAFLALPDDVLTGKYIITAWPNGFVGVAGGEYDRHSEFAVIATEDGTTVNVTPTAPLSGQGGRDPFTVVLDKGEVYFGQAILGGGFDVSGTEIRANKPVAVYAGNQRTAVPITVGNFRDHLVEQMPPIDAWGRTAILTPHFAITPSSTYRSEARIIAASDNTEVKVATAFQTLTYVLNSKQPLQVRPLQAAYIEASKPILVAQYEHSVGDYVDPGNPNSPAGMGDPFMMLIPPSEQYDTAYSFQSVIHPEFTKHYINVIVPNGLESSLRLDGNPIVDAQYSPIPGIDFSYAQIEVSPGSHYIRADDQFGLAVYGFGRANSYGYPGGTLFRTLVVDFERPLVDYNVKCEGMEGIFWDDRLTDSGIDSCYSTTASENVDVMVPTFEVGADTVRWNAQLVDPYQDGIVEMKGIDRAGRSTLIRDTIPGFTVGATKVNVGKPIERELVAFNGKEECISITLYNYGMFPQEIKEVQARPDMLTGLKFTHSLPFVLQPGDSTTFQLCYTGALENVEEIFLFITNQCLERSVVHTSLITVIDTIPPSIGVNGEPCGNTTIVIAEPELPYLQIESVVIDSIFNATWELNPSPLPAGIVSLQLQPIDFREEMFIQVSATDRGGNRITFVDTIPGFTVAVQEEPRSERLAIRLDTDWMSDSLLLHQKRCDSLLLVNYGTHPLTVSRIFMKENVDFSIPPSQLPFFLGSGEEKKVAICLEGQVAGEQIDTLWIEDDCGRWESVLLRTPVKPVAGQGADICGSSLNVQSFGATKRTFLTTSIPNPAPAGLISVDLGLQRNEFVSISVLDLTGMVQLKILVSEEIEAGVHRLEFDGSTLQAGVYFCQMITSSGEGVTAKFVIQE